MRSLGLLLSLCWAATAVAGSVYLNGVRIDGVTNQKFEKVTVRIDDSGNVLIDAPGYNVRQVEGPPDGTARAEPPGTLTKKYFLVTEQTAPGMTEYDIDVYVNSKWLRRLRNSDEQIVSDITKNLTPGKNTVMFIAKKAPGTSRKSFSKGDIFRIIVGEGTMSGDHVMIDNPVIKFERSAADTNDLTQELTLTTR
jgi:hypothetical protein